MEKICIHHCAGSGGMFLLTLFANYLKLKPKNQLDAAHGDYHNSGTGDWKNNNSKICWIGNHWDIGWVDDPNIVLYYTHRHEYVTELKKRRDNVKIVAIDCEDDDYHNITKLYIKKAWINLWTQQERDKWVSTGCDHFPPYDMSNLEDPLVYDTLHSQLNLDTINWHRTLDRGQIDYLINFKTVFGLDKTPLSDIISNITRMPVTDDIKKIIHQYQKINKDLYF
jgi:hypothetical protein